MIRDILLIDNYDSFTYNLFQYIGEITGKEPIVRKNDEVDIESVKTIDPQAIIISPGPGHPANKRDRGNCSEIIEAYYLKLPILGICMGHQIIGYSFGGNIIHAPEVMHGKCSEITLNDDPIYYGLPKKINVMRYHSLVIDSLCFMENFAITSETDDGIIMGIKHNKTNLYGLQFHPESIGTDYGQSILRNFLQISEK